LAGRKVKNLADGRIRFSFDCDKSHRTAWLLRRRIAITPKMAGISCPLLRIAPARVPGSSAVVTHRRLPPPPGGPRRCARAGRSAPGGDPAVPGPRRHGDDHALQPPLSRSQAGLHQGPGWCSVTEAAGTGGSSGACGLASTDSDIAKVRFNAKVYFKIFKKNCKHKFFSLFVPVSAKS